MKEKNPKKMAGPQTLARIGLFAETPAAARETLEKRCTWHRVAKDEQIINRESGNRDVYFIVEGRVRVVNYSLSGREISFDDLEAGNYFGEMAALDDGPRSAHVVALESTMVASVSPAAFVEFMEHNPKVALKVMRRLSFILRRAVERIMDLSTLGANNRVHAEILRQAGEHMTGDNTAAISPIPHHNDIAGRVSTTRETVARVLSELAQNGVVIREGKSLVVPDVARLETLVEDVRGQ